MGTESEDELNKNLLIIHSQFPRIGKALELFWGDKEFSIYVAKLLADGRSNRKGFPFEIAAAITSLHYLHDKEFPQFRLDDPEDWSTSTFGTIL